jgi:hypothetical protein
MARTLNEGVSYIKRFIFSAALNGHANSAEETIGGPLPVRKRQLPIDS